MYKKILVPLDGSELAEVALPYAEELAERLDAEINMIVVDDFNMNKAHGHTQIHPNKKVENVQSHAEWYLGQLAVKAEKVKSTTLIGHPAEAIVAHADMEDIDLIVMATHGRSGIKRWALGSVADKVVRATSRPVALIRAKDAHPDVRDKVTVNKILVPLDGSETSEAVIPYVIGLGSKLKAEVILLEVVKRIDHVYGSDMTVARVPYTDEEMEPLKRAAMDHLLKTENLHKGSGVELRTEVKIGDAAEEIIKFADEVNADLVAMATHGRSGISRWNLGSVASKVLHAGNTPLLLVRSTGDSNEYPSEYRLA